MRLAIAMAFALAAAPFAAVAQANLGNTAKDQQTSDVQRDSSKAPSDTATQSDDQASARSGQKTTVIENTPADKAKVSTGTSTQAETTKDRSVDQVRKDKSKALKKARSAKRQREQSGKDHWDAPQNTKTVPTPDDTSNPAQPSGH